MKTFKQNLGKVSITIDKNPWDDSKCYDRLVVVRPEGEFKTYISRKPVPEGIELSDTEYWLPFTALDESYIASLREIIETKLNTDGSNAQNFELDCFGANRIYRKSQGQETPEFGIIIPNISNNSETFLISSDKENWVHFASYDSNSKRINFYGNLNNVLCYIDATDFIKDGMIDNVYIANGKLIITFNTEAGKEDIEIPLTDIFNPNNYYTKLEVDNKLTLKTDLTQHQVLVAQVTAILGFLENKENKFFVVNCNISSENVITTNVTYDELNTAFTQEKHCVLKLSSAYHSIFFISDLTKSGDVFTARGLYNNRHFIVTIYKNSSDETIVTYNIREIQDKLVNGTNIASINNQSLLNGGNINVQAVINALNKLDADLVDDTNSTHKFITAAERTLWNTVTDKAPLPFVVSCGINPENASFVYSTLDEIWEAYQNNKTIRVKFAKAGGVSFEDDATLLLDGSRNCVVHTVHNGTHYTITIYEDDGVTKLSYEETHDSDKQDVLVSGTNIKTINGNSILGSGNINTYETFVVDAGISPENTHTINKTISEINQANNNGKILRLHLGNAYDNISFEEDLTRVGVYENNEYKNTYVSHTVKSGVHYIVTIYEEDNTTKFSFETVLDSDKQDVISDLSTIRSGAAAGATAYQKPSSGIPASDIAAGVIPDVSNFITNSVNNLVNYYVKSDTYTRNEVKDLISAINQFHYEVHPSLADITTPESNVLYLIGPQGAGTDLYEEYVYPNSTQGLTKIGDTSIDLSNYVTTQALNTALANYTTTTDLNTLLSGKQDTLVSGTNIKTINNTSVLGSGNLTLENSSNKTNDIANNDADTTKYPSCKGVADYVSAIVGNINSILETI